MNEAFLGKASARRWGYLPGEGTKDGYMDSEISERLMTFAIISGFLGRLFLFVGQKGIGGK